VHHASIEVRTRLTERAAGAVTTPRVDHRVTLRFAMKKTSLAVLADAPPARLRVQRPAVGGAGTTFLAATASR
jgi:ABC-type uncharacterized transport system YnjBCD substrate-binding protein